MQRPLAQENWLGGQVRAGGWGADVRAYHPVPSRQILPSPTILCSWTCSVRNVIL